jgi:hypothetical protein
MEHTTVNIVLFANCKQLKNSGKVNIGSKSEFMNSIMALLAGGKGWEELDTM